MKSGSDPHIEYCDPISADPICPFPKSVRGGGVERRGELDHFIAITGMRSNKLPLLPLCKIETHTNKNKKTMKTMSIGNNNND